MTIRESDALPLRPVCTILRYWCIEPTRSCRYVCKLYLIEYMPQLGIFMLLQWVKVQPDITYGHDRGSVS